MEAELKLPMFRPPLTSQLVKALSTVFLVDCIGGHRENHENEEGPETSAVTW